MPDTRLLYEAWHKNRLAVKIARYEKNFHNRLLQILGAKKGESILDLGCGRGGFCHSAFMRGLNVYGADFSVTALKDAESLNNNINFVPADAANLPFRDKFFDYVVCLGSFEHFTDKVAVLREIKRILKDNGKVFMFLPNSYFLGHIYFVCKTGLPIDEAAQEFSESFNTKLGWEKILEENSFRVLAIHKFNTIWASKKAPKFTKYIYNFLLKPFIPFNLSYAFGYLCVKNESGQNS